MKILLDKIVSCSNIREAIIGIDDLAANIKDMGQLQPVIVCKSGDKWEILDGNCRLAAAKKLGWKAIEAHVVEAEQKNTRIAIGIFANIKRNAYTPSEEAKALAWLQENWKAAGEIDKGGRPEKTSASGAGVSKERLLKPVAQKVREETGMAERTFRRKAMIGARMSEATAKALDKGEITQKQAEIVVRADKDKQASLIQQVKGRPIDATRSAVQTVVNPTIERQLEENIRNAKRWLETFCRESSKVTSSLSAIRTSGIMYEDVKSAINFTMAFINLEEEVKKFNRWGENHHGKANRDHRMEKGKENAALGPIVIEYNQE